MNKLRLAVVLVFAAVAGISQAAKTDEIMEFKVDKSIRVPTAPESARKAWHDDRFGMFIHWGPISQMGQALSHSRNSPSHRTGGKPYKKAAIPPEVYDNQYKTFNPTNYNPDAIAKLAKAAGARYVVFTAKHHAGFSMFDSAMTEYDIMSAPYKHDIVKMLSDACHANGINFGFYYSPRDWHHPDCDSDNHHDRYIKFFKAQMLELLTKYGPIYEVWFDGLGPGRWGNTSREIMLMIRKTNPNAMVNNRGGAGADFYTPEQTISYFNRKRLWEACYTTSGQWGYNPRVGVRSIEQLMEILLYAWGSDGNMLLNIGPAGDGAVRAGERERWEQIADWWKVHGDESIRSSRGGPYLPGAWGAATCKDRRVFLHIFRWPKDGGALFFPALTGLKPQKARLLSGKAVELQSVSGGFAVKVPEGRREGIVTTVEVTFDGDTVAVAPLPRVASLTTKAKLSASHNEKDLENLRDQDADTYWTASLKKGESEILLNLDFKNPETIASFYIARGEKWTPRLTAELQVPDGSGGWKRITPKRLNLKIVPLKFLDKPVTTQKLRLRITGAKRFTCAELEIYAPVASARE
jgi:alpha-L-fucosidase